MSGIDDILLPVERSVDWPDPLPARMSPSSLTTFLTCPEQWRRKYLLKERGPTAGVLLIGRADSKAREQDMRHKILTGQNLDVAVVKEIAAEAFDFECDEADETNEGIDWEDTTAGKCKDMAVACAAAYSDQVAAQIMPVATEHHVELSLPNLPALHGYIDIVEADRIREIKTSNRRPGNNTASPAWLTQTLLYSAVTGLPTHFDVAIKKQHPEIVSGLTEPGLVAHTDSLLAEQRLKRVLGSSVQMILGLLERVGPDTEWPGTASAAAAASPCGWCQFNTDCRFVIR